jgi:hypothetical protein
MESLNNSTIILNWSFHIPSSTNSYYLLLLEQLLIVMISHEKSKALNMAEALHLPQKQTSI